MKKYLSLLVFSCIISFSQEMFVDAKSGLNYRDTPKGKKIGKLPYKTEVKIVKHSGVYQWVKDEGLIFEGEWVGIQKDNRVVYVWDGFLSKNKPIDNYKVFKYETVLCYCFGKYDPKKYTQQQLKNISDYFVNDLGKSSSLFFYNTSPSKLEDVDKLEIDEFIEKSSKEIKFYKNLNIPKTVYWQQRRRERIAYLKALQIFEKITILGYKNPKELLKYDVKDSEIEYYRGVLIEGGDEMIKAWRNLVDEQKLKNGSPQSLEDEYQEQVTSERKYDYARMNLMRYRWNSGKTLPKVNSENDDEEFDKLFINVNCGCDD